jgi:putative transcriptional regulator
MKTVRMKIDVLNPTGKLSGRIDARRVDATTGAGIARHKVADNADAMLDAAKFARRVRRR